MLAFLVLGFRSLQTQWRRLTGAQPTTAGLKLSEVAVAIETRTTSLAREWFKDEQSKYACVLAQNSRTARDRRRVRAALEGLEKRYPIAQYAFFIQGGTVRFPRVQSAPVRSSATYALQNDRVHGRRFLSLLNAAQQHTTMCSNAAIQRLREARVLTSSDALKALALVRTAACLNKSGMRRQADGMYDEVTRLYGDEYDPSDIPYALVATAARERVEPAELERMYRDLIHGRWELASDQVYRYRDLLRRRMGGAPPQENTDFLDELEAARALQAALNRHASSSYSRTADDGLFWLAFRGEAKDYQSFYAESSDQKNAGWWGVTINLDYLERAVLPELGVGETVEIAFSSRAANSHSRVGFPTAFPFWELMPSTAATQRRAARTDGFVLLGSCVLLALIAFGAVTLHRHLAREREVNRLRSEIISGVTHELKTPITLIRLYSETLLKSSELHQDSREYCGIICDEAQRLTRLVDDILDFTPIERGAKQYSMHASDIGAAAEQIIALVRPYFWSKGFTISSEIAEDLPPVSFDPEALKSALLNLLDNAVKYSGTATVVRVEAYESKSSVVLAVQDQGIGIAESEREKIFQPYYRADIGMARGGCGLGLALVQHIMAAHGGSVRLKSEVNAGSRFELIFPNYDCESVADAALEPENSVLA